MRLTPCDKCGYLLDSAQARTHCPECGLSAQRQHREDARRILERPTYLALLALILWRPLPLALWSTRASASVIRRIRRDSRRLCVWTLILGAVLVALPGSVLAYESYILETPAGYVRRSFWYDLWGLHCNRATTSTPAADLDSLLRSEGGWIEPPYGLTWMPVFDPICCRWRIDWAWAALKSFPTQQLVCLPATTCVLSLLILSFVSRSATRRPDDIQLSRLSRASLMAAASNACLTPLRLAWFAALLVAVVFFLAPGAAIPLRRAAWYCLILFATMGPPLIAARIVLADRPGSYIRRRRFVALMLVLFGGVVPSILVHYVLASVTYWLWMQEIELKRILSAYPGR